MLRSPRYRYGAATVIVALLVWFVRSALWRDVVAYLEPLAMTPSSFGYQAGDALRQGSGTWLGGSGAAVDHIGSPDKLAQASAERAELTELRLENVQLRQQLALPSLPENKMLGAEIIGRRQDETATTYLINRGSRQGLAVGMPVVVAHIAVGTIVRVQEAVAEVALVTSPLFAATVEVLNPSTTRGVVEGEFNLAVRLRFVPASDGLAVGETVITSGLDELVPRGLVVGRIAAVEKPEGDFFQSAIVVPPIDVAKLRFLWVVTK